MRNFTVTWQLSVDSKEYSVGGGFPLSLSLLAEYPLTGDEDAIKVYVIDQALKEIEMSWSLEASHLVRITLREWGVKDPLWVEHVDGLGLPTMALT